MSTPAADLERLLSSAAAISAPAAAEELLIALRQDQQRRWRTDQPWLAEDYLNRLPQLPPGVAWRLELVTGEWHSRPAHKSLSQYELQSRFPDLADLPAHLVAFPETADPLLMIDHVCDRFEQLHRSGSVKPRLEFCLANLPPHCRSAGFRRLLEVDLKVVRQGEQQTIVALDWKRQFPRYATEVDRVFATTVEQHAAVEAPGIPPTAAVTPTAAAAADVPPEMIGRFRIEKELGRGGCGRVLLGYDNQLNIPYALKQVLKKTAQDIALLTREARVVAELGQSLDHQGIVRVLEVFEHNQLPVMVMDYKSGGDLARRLRQAEGISSPPFRQLPPAEAVSIIREIAAILQAAHEKGIYHRDLKPANVLIDGSGKLWLTDFGLALRDEEWASDPAQGGGTLVYTAPEQVLGISRDVDGRVDIWSLGVMLYQMLSGHLPFTWESRAKFIEQTQKRGMRPLQQRDRSIPGRLSRICEKCLRPDVDQRYHSVAELLEALLTWDRPLHPATAAGTELPPHASPPSASPVIANPASGAAATAQPDLQDPALSSRFRIRPRGLESYTEADRHFFLRLLPGDLEADNLPESIHYWCNRLEVAPVNPADGQPSSHNSAGSGRDWRRGAQAFPVGVIHGSSGCGKSSFVKAGLLPLLPQHVLRIYLEASPHGTEMILVRELRRLFPQISRDLTLPDILRGLQDGLWLPEEQRLLIVLDQFEQWLDEHAGETGTELGIALRHCVPGRVQTLLLVREEYWTATSEFMTSQLLMELSTRWNDQMLPLFSESHARMVLAAFGQFYGRLARDESQWTADQQAFLDQAVQDLSQKGRITPVHLAVFAQMFRELPWTPERLKKEGGAAGAGVRFLENQFSSAETPERQRRHLDAARRLLEELLPAEGTLIRGHRRSHSHLQKECGYGGKPRRFAELLQILEQELKLITRTDSVDETADEAGESWYLLTHDFLVPSIRQWVATELSKTASGRALAKLRLREKNYSERGETRQLPSLAEWLQIRFLTSSKGWTSEQKDLMRRALWWNGLRAAVLLPFLVIGIIQLATLIRPWLYAALEARLSSQTMMPAGPEEVARLQEALLTGQLDSVASIYSRLRPHAEKLRPQWLELLRNPAEPAARRFRAALGLVGLDGDEAVTEWTDADVTFITTELTTSFGEYQPQLRTLLQPLGKKLVPALDLLFDAETSTTDQQISATLALADFARDDKELLARLLTRATARQTEILYTLVAETKTGPVRDGLLALTREQPDENLGQLDRVRLGRRRANAAITLLRQGERDAYFDALRITDDPESLSQFVHRCRSWGVTPVELLESFDRCAELRKTATGAAKRLESRVLYGLLIALGSYSLEQVPESSREEVFAKLRALYESDPSAAVHSASGWLLRTWGREADVARLDKVAVPYDDSGEREWFRLRVGVRPKADEVSGAEGEKQVHSLTFVAFPAREYRLGSPEFEGGELDRSGDETPRVVRLTRPFALCDREVTWGLFDAFDGGELRETMTSQPGWGSRNDDVAFGVNYIRSIQFCCWLTRQYCGDEEHRQCYVDASELNVGGNSHDVGRLLLDRGGFRMPTESEWEVGARSGQRTAYTFGSDVSLLSSYGWFVENSSGKRPQLSGSKPPGVGGLHDVQGNLFEWVHDWYGAIEGGSVELDPQGPEYGQGRVLRGGTWDHNAAYCRTASRVNRTNLALRYPNVGFRLALSLSGNTPPEGDAKQQQQQQEAK